MPFRLKEALYWTVREALHNVVKHARASDVRILMESTSEHITMAVIDNGIGFDADTDFPGHIGLQSMRERCEQIDAELHIESEIGKGSKLSVKVPLVST